MTNTGIQKGKPRNEQKSKNKKGIGKISKGKNEIKDTADQDENKIKASLSSMMESLDRRMEEAVLSTRRHKVSVIRQPPTFTAQVLTSQQQKSRNGKTKPINGRKSDDNGASEGCEQRSAKKPEKSQTRGTIIESQREKKLRIRVDTKRRATRMVDTKKRRQNIEKDRVQHLHSNGGQARQQRLKKQSVEKQGKCEQVRNLAMCVQLAMRVQLAIDTVKRFRAYQQQLIIEDLAARVITRQLRTFKFKKYRKRITGALFILSTVFVMKIRLWKHRKRRCTSDIIRAFLVSLDTENRRTGGCLALIVKGKTWRVYRQKIIFLQRLWRARLQYISAQAMLVDLQWRREQDKLIESHVDALYNSSIEKATEENEEIESINRTRKLIKLRPLPRKQYVNRSEIKRSVMKGDDLLSINHICPMEIRIAIIKSMIRYLRLNRLTQIKQYKRCLDDYNKEMQNIQQRRAILVRFSGSEIANSWIKVENNERHLMALGGRAQPRKPNFSVILGQGAIDKLIETGESYVKVIRQAWKPNIMTIPDLTFDGKLAAEVHLKEIENQGNILHQNP